LATVQDFPARKPPRRFSVDRLTVTDFRSYGRLRVECDSRPAVLTGPNGAGKTNLLEALSFLVPGRGLREARLADVGRRDALGVWSVAARVASPDGTVEIGTGMGDGGRRRVRIDGRNWKSTSALSGAVNVQWLTPGMDRLFTGASAERRRFLDRLVYGFDAAHAGRVSAYEHAMRERSRLLRGAGRADPRWLDALEETMAEKGIAVAAARREVVARLNHLSANADGPFPGAGIEVKGVVEDWLQDIPALQAEDRFRAALASSRPADAEVGGAGTGPHKSDLDVRHAAGGQPANQCSTGEQKALLIAIVLANVRMQADAGRPVPVLLLDEVAAHLDRERCQALFSEIMELGAQAWLTGTDPAIFRPLLGSAKFFTVHDGRLTEEAS
jgi:DNA replication and repair protein RecF